MAILLRIRKWKASSEASVTVEQFIKNELWDGAVPELRLSVYALDTAAQAVRAYAEYAAQIPLGS